MAKECHKTAKVGGAQALIVTCVATGQVVFTIGDWTMTSNVEADI